MANKKKTDDCDTCKIVSFANCLKCEELSEPDYRWVRREGFDDIEWDDAPDKAGSLE